MIDETALPPTIEVTVAFPADLPAALADPSQIRIVFGNLFRNAGDAMPSGGRLTLTGSTMGTGSSWTVTDTGEGIRPEDLGRIMEPLFSTKARGLGLGLAISRMILERNQGSLHVASEVAREARSPSI